MVVVQKRKIRWVISLLLVMLYFSCLPAQAQYGGGSGEPNDPYLIYTAEQMNTIGAEPNDWDKHFKLMADIDLSDFADTDFNIIGNQVFPFAGVFDGNGKKILNFNYTCRPTDDIGLFGYVSGANAQIKDLGLIDPNVDVEWGSKDIGSLVGCLYNGTVANCYVEDASISAGGPVGGLVGYNSGTIINCTSSASIFLGWLDVGGLVGHNSGTIINCTSSASIPGVYWNVGGLVGWNSGRIIECHSSGELGAHGNPGGLVGRNSGIISNCYSSSDVSGDHYPGGLVGGFTKGIIANCYSTGSVSGRFGRGSGSGGGLVGKKEYGAVYDSFWDIETSGQSTSYGGTGLPTAEMQMASTFTDAGWDFVNESENGTEDIWWILEGQDYPMFVWELWASSPNPQDGATNVFPPLILRWRPGGLALYHDIYFGEDEDTVANATTLSLGIYRGQQPGEVATYDPSSMEWGRTYYWRIDEVNENDPNSPWKGNVWSFTTANFIVVDDFEDYNDFEPDIIWDTWLDGWGVDTNGAEIGYGDEWESMETTIVHGGRQSMPYFYENNFKYSEATLPLVWPRDWTQDGVGVLSLWFYGHASYYGHANAAERMYVAIANSGGTPAAVYHDDPNAPLINTWTEWNIDLQEFADQDVNLSNVDTISIGFGDKNNLQPGGWGLVLFDDIRLYRPVPEPEPAQ